MLEENWQNWLQNSQISKSSPGRKRIILNPFSKRKKNQAWIFIWSKKWNSNLLRIRENENVFNEIALVVYIYIYIYMKRKLMNCNLSNLFVLVS